ncbi:beta strand repeat-containing protein [Tahibacter soli]|uniref:Proprotein convertase P-domain-containing protein n=1 Tax=Tahibacter soli TaxID=2983605 RepID=A0A9X4BGE6_9GAMM|nr:proprotein convertase P-domain-containing protein [Tahibacter soli]MDC8011441.1 proprotein convertase P-domain-containing protein [Tahibacter soli]
MLELYASDGTTILEGDEDDGSFGTLSSSIAGTTLATAGTYYLRVKHNSATAQLRPYHLYFQLRSGTPTPETEPNDTAPGQALPVGGWVDGSVASATDVDFYSITLNAGDTVFLSLDQDPERNGDSNLRLGLGVFDTLVLLVNDSGAGFAPYTAPDSEAYFMTVKDAGTYSIYVDTSAAATFGTYHLSATVFPRVTTGVNCTTYTSTNVPVAVPDVGSVTSTLTVPGNPRIADINVAIQGNHTFMADYDVHLISPAGNDVGLFTDVFNQTTGGRSLLDIVIDDEAAIPPAFQVSAGMRVQPEFNYRLAWFDGENAGGTWTLQVRDDVAVDTGSITGWSIEICEAPPPPACAPGFVPQTVYSTDFESGAAGFTHSGTADEWELGLPATVATATANPVAAFNTCASGTNCWKTDLDNTYNASSSQDLLSAPINLAGLSPPVVVSWAHRYQMDTATNDHYNVSIQQVGLPATAIRLFEHLDAVMTDAVGNPVVQVPASAGWGVVDKRADTMAGNNVELLFHLDSGTGATNFGGAAIDDVTVTACRAATADLSITKTDGVTTATPGGSVTYTITASNAGTDAVTGATVADSFPASLTCTWTCVGAGGGTCTAAGSGNINDATNLPVGGSVTYTATCAVNASATGTLSNTATVSSAISDPNPANNSATDTDTLTPNADLAITKTDGVTTATPGGSVTYTITASNAGPSNAPGSTIADTFPASLTCTWTCVGAGGGTCTAAGSGNIGDTANLPAGGSVTYTVSCAVSAAASGTLSNTATVAAPAGVTDPNPANNSATDTDTVTPSADLSITKTDGVASVTAGGSTTYTIVAANAGPSNATGATVADTFPASLTCAWTCVGAGGGTCTASGSGNIGDTVNLPAGGSTTYTATCAVALAATGTLSNTATVAAPAGVTDPNPANNAATDTDTINAAGANVAGTKTVAGTFTPGASVTYTVTLTNSGGPQGDNPGNEFTDVLPASLTLVSASASSGTAVASVGTNTVTWNGPIPIAGSVTITINATISPSATGTIANQGSISYDGDGNGTNDATRTTDDPAVGGAADPTQFTVGGAVSDLSITKTDGVASATPGGSTTYTIVASNAGPSNATGATVTDTFPAALTCTWTCAGAGGGTCAASGSGNIGDTVNIPDGGSVTYTATCAIGASASGSLANTASVAVPVGTNDPDPANNSATDTDTLAASADIAVTKTNGGTTSTAGGTTAYTVVVSNAGPSDAAGVTVNDTLPAALTCTWTCAGTAGGTCTASGSGSIADTANLPGGASVTYALACSISASATGSLVNTASAAAPAGTADPTPGNDSATDTDALGASADLAVTKTDGVTTVLAGGVLTYTIAATNATGPSAAIGATVNDTLPAECAAPTWACAATGGAVCPASGSGSIAASVDLPAGGAATFTVTCPVSVAAAIGTVITNTATIAAPAGLTDPTPGNDSATDTTTVAAREIAVPVPALGIWALLLAALGLVALARRGVRRTD